MIIDNFNHEELMECMDDVRLSGECNMFDRYCVLDQLAYMNVDIPKEEYHTLLERYEKWMETK